MIGHFKGLTASEARRVRELETRLREGPSDSSLEESSTMSFRAAAAAAARTPRPMRRVGGVHNQESATSRSGAPRLPFARGGGAGGVAASDVCAAPRASDVDLPSATGRACGAASSGACAAPSDVDMSSAGGSGVGGVGASDAAAAHSGGDADCAAGLRLRADGPDGTSTALVVAETAIVPIVAETATVPIVAETAIVPWEPDSLSVGAVVVA